MHHHTHDLHIAMVAFVDTADVELQLDLLSFKHEMRRESFVLKRSRLSSYMYEHCE